MTQIKHSFGARWAVPIDRPPLRDVCLTVSDGVITSLAANQRKRAEVDLGEVVIFPQLVNAHTHLEFSSLRQPLGQAGHSITSWIPQVVDWRKKQTARQTKLAIVAGLGESWREGTAGIGEIATRPWFLDTQLPNGLMVRCFVERLSLDPQQSQPLIEQAKPWLRDLSAMAGALPGISPHAPYSLSDELFLGLVDWARQQALPMAMHLAESPEEMEWLATGQGPFRDMLKNFGIPAVHAGPRRALHYLTELARTNHALVIHGNYLATDELEFMAKHKQLHLVFCPRSHAWFGHATYPLLEAIRLGIHVAVGTDSRASNPDLSVLAELRSIRANFPELAPQTILEMGTLNGAKALQIAAWAGSLSPGKQGGFLSIPLRSDHDPLGAILDTCQSPTTIFPGPGNPVSNS